MVNAVQKLKDNDYWVIASDHHAEDNYYNIDYTDMNFAIIMGAEHAGISKSLLKLADFKVKIPMLTNFNSLNVSNAAAISIYEVMRQLDYPNLSVTEVQKGVDFLESYDATLGN